tara:strand:+ start:625 stop:1083 length:459 start_codon:yes stop_codon:yes gene_type:complete
LAPETIVIKESAQKYHIPAQLVITEEIPPQPKKQRPQKKAPSKKTKAKRAAKKSAPKRQPGDRDIPEIIGPSKTTPVMPKAALNYGWTGTIKVVLTIDKDGRILNHKIIRSTGHDVLDQSFIRTVQKNWKFKPKRVFGKNKIGQVQLSYTFE